MRAKNVVTLLAVTWLFGGMAQAVPVLQLDIAPGVFDLNTSPVNPDGETMLATSPQFTLFALVDSSEGRAQKYDIVGGKYYVSAAIVPDVNIPQSIGSFGFDGKTVNVTEDMTLGTPANLPTHGIFPTYYKEFAFSVDTTKKTQSYNIQDVAGTHWGPTADAAGLMYYVPFAVDVGNIPEDYFIHFDLYGYVTENGGPSKKVYSSVEGKAKKNGTQVDFIFAPFSHDAGGNQVPDGGTSMSLLGLALFGMEIVRRRLA